MLIQILLLLLFILLTVSLSAYLNLVNWKSSSIMSSLKQLEGFACEVFRIEVSVGLGHLLEGLNHFGLISF